MATTFSPLQYVYRYALNLLSVVKMSIVFNNFQFYASDHPRFNQFIFPLNWNKFLFFSSLIYWKLFKDPLPMITPQIAIPSINGLKIWRESKTSSLHVVVTWQHQVGEGVPDVGHRVGVGAWQHHVLEGGHRVHDVRENICEMKNVRWFISYHCSLNI